MNATDLSFAKLKAVQPHLARRVAVTHFDEPPKEGFSKALDYSQLFGAKPNEKTEKMASTERVSRWGGANPPLERGPLCTFLL